MPTKKFVPVAQKVKKIQESNNKLKKHIQRTAISIRKANMSKANPRLKTLRIKKLRSLQIFLQSAIIYNNERMKQLKSPS